MKEGETDRRRASNKRLVKMTMKQRNPYTMHYLHLLKKAIKINIPILGTAVTNACTQGIANDYQALVCAAMPCIHSILAELLPCATQQLMVL